MSNAGTSRAVKNILSLSMVEMCMDLSRPEQCGNFDPFISNLKRNLEIFLHFLHSTRV